ncbi:MAG: PilN domain-containing protein [Candidatus Aminicenantes bacterium]|nr:MAG: PilN domain-containing protein [Candidatus Aminicenantes bacterium]
MIRINLLKPEKKELKEVSAVPVEEVKKAKKQLSIQQLAILGLIVILALYFITQRNALKKESNLLRIAKEEKSKLQNVSAKLKKLRKQKETFERKINLINELRDHQSAAVNIMDELSKSLPEWVWLTEITYRSKRVQLKGRALSNNLIADYIANLEASPHFENVNLISSSQKATRSNQFMEYSLTANFILPKPPASTPEKTTKKVKK